jgi:glycosyltransferase involved in cell wall biosynthesis
VTGLSVVLPCYNEGAQVGRAHAAITGALADITDLELVIVDDGSTDDTLAKVKALADADPRVKYLSFSRNFGLEAAHAAGFRYASKPWLVQLDADLQSPPEETWKLLAKAAEGGYDVVFALRVDRQDPPLRRFCSWAVHVVARRLLGVDVPDGVSTFRVMRTAVAQTLADLELGSPYTIAMVPLIGARYACVPTMHARRPGRSRWRFARLAGHGFELFFGYSWRPLNAVYLVAAGSSAAATGVLAVNAAGSARPGLVPATTLTLAAVSTASTALVGRYLYRLMLDLRRTRPYYIREANVPLRPEDTLDGGAPVLPPPVRSARLPAAAS